SLLARRTLFRRLLFCRFLLDGLPLRDFLFHLARLFRFLYLLLLFGFLFGKFKLPVVAHGLPILSAIPDENFASCRNVLRCLYEAAFPFDNVLAVVSNSLDPDVASRVVGITAQCIDGRQRVDYALAVDVEEVPVLSIIILNVLPYRAPSLVFHDTRGLTDKHFCKQTLTGIG